MVPTEQIHPPFRWEFVPVESPADKAVHWTWRAYDRTGNLVIQATRRFETRAECVEDATANGHRPQG